MRYLDGARALSALNFVTETRFLVSVAVPIRSIARTATRISASTLLKLVDCVRKLLACFGIQISCN